MSHPVSCTIDLSAGSGKQVGELRLPRGTDDGAFVSIPIATIANGDGPAVLVSAGTHGDEYEGQIAARRLLAEVEPAQVSGRLIVIPTVSTGGRTGALALLAVGRELQPLASRAVSTARPTRCSRTTSRPRSSPSST